MKKQDILNSTIKTYLVDGKEPGWDTQQVVCRYRGDNGSKCAVGHLIPDSVYNRTFEGRTYNNLRLAAPEVEKLLGSENISFLIRLQHAHDGAATDAHRKVKEDGKGDYLVIFRSILRKNLIKVAEEFKLVCKLPVTAQEMLDKVVNKFIKNRKRPATKNDGSVCAYRTETGDRCAIGLCIPISRYYPTLEFVGASQLVRDNRDLFSLDIPYGFAGDLQECHDTSARNARLDANSSLKAFRAELLPRLQRLAVRYNLTLNI